MTACKQQIASSSEGCTPINVNDQHAWGKLVNNNKTVTGWKFLQFFFFKLFSVIRPKKKLFSVHITLQEQRIGHIFYACKALPIKSKIKEESVSLSISVFLTTCEGKWTIYNKPDPLGSSFQLERKIIYTAWATIIVP